MIEGSGSGSIPLTNESGSMRPKNMWIRWIRYAAHLACLLSCYWSRSGCRSWRGRRTRSSCRLPSLRIRSRASPGASRKSVRIMFLTVLRIRIRDPVPFSPRDPGWVKSGSGSGMNNPDHISESIETFFWVKIL
jgi:hypothetical protein